VRTALSVNEFTEFSYSCYKGIRYWRVLVTNVNISSVIELMKHFCEWSPFWRTFTPWRWNNVGRRQTLCQHCNDINWVPAGRLQIIYLWISECKNSYIVYDIACLHLFALITYRVSIIVRRTIIVSSVTTLISRSGIKCIHMKRYFFHLEITVFDRYVYSENSTWFSMSRGIYWRHP
jgi:hypothetical protein